MKVAKNIFELGLKSFLKETEYVLDYAGFLVSQGDISNARILYERALTVAQGRVPGQSGTSSSSLSTSAATSSPPLPWKKGGKRPSRSSTMWTPTSC